MTSIELNFLSPPAGDSEGNYPVEIHGEEMKHIAKVYFGRAEAAVLDRQDDVITVKAPAGSGVVEVHAVSQRGEKSNALEFQYQD
jgi:hypothetical protein